MTKALLLDDSKSFLNTLHLALSNAGVIVISTTNRRDFNYYLKSFKPDVILIDVFLQKVDGRSLCQKITTNPSLCPVILMSENPHALSSYLEYGATDSIQKSLPIVQIIEKINQVVNNKYTFKQVQDTSNYYTQFTPTLSKKFSFSSFTKMFL